MSSIYQHWAEFEDEQVEPQNSSAIVIPDLTMKANDVPEELRERVERIWDDAFKAAIEFTDHAAKMLKLVYEATHDAPE
jgi:hypothetical protein